jgi:hypothetical protein
MGAKGTTGMTTPVDKQTAYFKLRSQGWSRAAACKKIGISQPTGLKLDRGANPAGAVIQAERVQASFGRPIPYEDLNDRAKRAFNDFAFFQRTYLGRVVVPWQVEAAEKIVQAVDSDEESWIVVNCPPGSGKSTCFTHDLPAWLTIRNRAMTGMLGSAVQNTAEAYIRRLKDTFERAVPLKADARLIRLGLAVDAQATLAEDFGRFKPENGIWSASQFVVEQHEGMLVAEKEPTWSAFGREGGVLGMRYQFVIWDDLVSDKRLNSQDLIDADREWYSDIAESRLEPGGTFILQGQRLGPNDLYGYALNMRRLPDELDPEAEYDDDIGSVPKYTHVVYKAHYEDRCEGKHGLADPAYGEPGGCLLYPRRLSWRRLSPMMLERANRFKVVYQQEDVDPETVLVQKDWISGAGGHVGCWDKDRDRLEPPKGVDLDKCLSVVTVDPSPTQYWAIEWWLIDPEGISGPTRYLIDLERRGMGANKFLDYIASEGRHVGFAEEWQNLSYQLRIPITHWIIEQNAAQRFMLQTDMIQAWQRKHGLRIIPHTTTAQNKNSQELGIQAIMPGPYERGLIRLPGKNTSANEKGRMVSMRLVDEVTVYPHGRTTDCVMAHWFLELHLPELLKSNNRRTAETVHTAPRPSWYQEQMTGLATVAGVRNEHPRRESGAQRMMAMLAERQLAS